MSATGTDIALGLMQLAVQFASGERVRTQLGRYEHPERGSLPIVPAEIHDALCPSLTVDLADLELGIVTCALCPTAIERAVPGVTR